MKCKDSKVLLLIAVSIIVFCIYLVAQNQSAFNDDSVFRSLDTDPSCGHTVHLKNGEWFKIIVLRRANDVSGAGVMYVRSHDGRRYRSKCIFKPMGVVKYVIDRCVVEHLPYDSTVLNVLTNDIFQQNFLTDFMEVDFDVTESNECVQ